MAITSAMCASAKRDFLNGVHCFAQSRSFTCTSTSTKTIAGISPAIALATPIFVGELVSGTNIPVGPPQPIVESIVSSTSITLSQAPSAAITAFTVAGDPFKMALIKIGMAGTYGAASTAYANITGNSDEVTGTGYTAGGTLLTNQDPVASSPSAFTTFSPNPSWTSASFSTAGCMIWNTIQNGPVVGPSVSVHDFGGTQTVTSGTFTVIMPVAAVGTAILQIT